MAWRLGCIITTADWIAIVIVMICNYHHHNISLASTEYLSVLTLSSVSLWGRHSYIPILQIRKQTEQLSKFPKIIPNCDWNICSFEHCILLPLVNESWRKQPGCAQCSCLWLPVWTLQTHYAEAEACCTVAKSTSHRKVRLHLASLFKWQDRIL